MNKTFSSYIIAETNLGTQCAEILLTEGHQVLGVVSNNQDVIKWAIEHNVPYFLTLKMFEEEKQNKTFDYLFSIVNGEILTPQILEYPRYFAINYHDSPLPKYAGVHATSWAILNNEKSHGISWHVMSSQVDAGDILKQVTFPIELNETALTLNLKCFTQAIEAFRTLIKDLAEGTVHKQSQDLQDRGYYSAHQKPQNAGIINWNKSAQEIDTLYRALYFGEYPNKLTTFKVIIGEQTFFPHKLEILKEKAKAKARPGTIVKIHTNGLQISTKTKDIIIRDVRDIQGKSCRITYLTDYFNLYEGYNLPNLNKKTTANLHQQLTTLFSYEAYWVKSLLRFTPVKLPFFDSISTKTNNQQVPKERDNETSSFITSKIDKKLLQEASKKFKDILFVDVLSSVFMIYLSRLDSKNTFSIDYADSSLKQLTEQLNPFLSPEIPLTIDKFDCLTGEEVVQRFIEEKTRALKHKAYPLDIKERHPTLQKQSYDKSDIKINIFKSKEKLIEKEASYLLEISISAEGERYILAFPQKLTKTEKQFIKAIPGHINTLLESLLKTPSSSLRDLSLLTTQEQHQLLIEWNDTKVDYPIDKTVHQLFEEQVEKTPENIAVVYEDEKLTYQQLNEKANQLAHYLRSLGVGPDTLAAIAVDRSLEMIIGLLGILKAGGAYVPLDPEYPQERLQFMLEDTRAPIVLTQTHLQDKLKETLSSYKGKVVVIDQPELQQILGQQNINNLVSITLPHHLAYVIYTSGSTGKPKGVLGHHFSSINRFFWMWNAYPYSTNEIAFCKTSLSFVDSIWEIFGPLLKGIKILLRPFNSEVQHLDQS